MASRRMNRALVVVGRAGTRQVAVAARPVEGVVGAVTTWTSLVVSFGSGARPTLRVARGPTVVRTDGRLERRGQAWSGPQDHEVLAATGLDLRRDVEFRLEA